MRRLVPITAVLGIACGRAAAGPAPRRCAPVAPDRPVASVFIDGRLVGDAVPVVRTAVEPETFDFAGDPPPAVRDLSAARIDLIQFVSGEAAAAEHGACPGMVAVLITTRPGR